MANECTMNKSLNFIIISGAVHCNKDYLNSFAIFSKENYAEKEQFVFSQSLIQ